MLKVIWFWLPCNEEDLAFLAVLFGGEIEVIDGISTLVGGQTGLEFVVAFVGFTELLHHNFLLLNFEHNEAVASLRF